ncbi:MAG: glycosyltransferase [Sedimentisphaerales bacterium]
MKKDFNNNGPLVSVLIPTFNRPRYFCQALRSVLNQSYARLQVIVVNDGGTDVSDTVKSFYDPRVIYINRKENRGKAFSLNEALEKSEGKYIAYLDDDDIFYPNHVEILVDNLENRTDCKVAYSDLYKAFCKVSQDGSRQVLSKVVEVSRDFDRFFMLLFNHVLHVSMMHRRDLLEKTGLYNEQLDVLIDWDMTRRLAFFTDFHHVYEITGQYYHPMGDCDRISVRQRKDKQNYLKNVLAIRTTRPAKPWPKINDLSIILVIDNIDRQMGKTAGSIWRHTFYPYKFHLPLPQTDMTRLNTDMPNLVLVPVNPLSSQTERIDAAIEQCEGAYIAIVPAGFPINDMWIEKSLYPLINSEDDKQGYLLEDSTEKLWAVVLRKEDLFSARRNYPEMSLPDSLSASGIVLKKPGPQELPFQFDNMLQQAFSAQNNGDWLQAAEIYEYAAENYSNELWMKSLASNALFNAGKISSAAALCSQVNRKRPTVGTLLLEAKARCREKEYSAAIELLTIAQKTIEEREYLWK